MWEKTGYFRKGGLGRPGSVGRRKGERQSSQPRNDRKESSEVNLEDGCRKPCSSWSWWYTLLVPTVRRLNPVSKIKASLVCTVSSRTG